MIDKRKKIIKIICYLFLLHPVFWLLGIDQIVWLTFPIILGIYAYFNNIKLKVPFILILFLIVNLLSGLAIPFEVHPWFYLPLFFYKLLAITSAIITFTLIYNLVNEISLMEKIMKFIIYNVFISVVVSMFFTTFLKKVIAFEAPLHYLLPGFLLKRGIVQGMLNKSLCVYGWFLGEKVCRLSGFFRYANTLADAIIVAAPFSIYFLKNKKSYVLIFLILVSGLILTTSRAGIASFLIGLLVYTTFVTFRNFYFSVSVILFVFLMFCFAFFAFPSFNSYVIHKFKKIKEEVLEARTIKGRESIYEKTWRYIEKRPFLGWGTNRRFYEFETLNIKIPHPYLGSHSGYLSILFRNGIIGLFIFILFLSKLGIIIVKKLLYEKDDRIYYLTCALLFGYLGLALHLLFLDNMHDFILLNLNWTLWGLIAALENIKTEPTRVEK